MPQGEAGSVETAPIVDRHLTARTYRRDLGRRLGGLPHESVSADFVVEWQLAPIGETETGPAETSRVHLQNLSL